MRNLWHLTGDQQSLIHAGWPLRGRPNSRLRRAVDPIGEVKRARSSHGFLFQRPERPDVDPPKLRHEVDVRRAAQGVRNGVAAMIMWTSAQRMAGHPACISRPDVSPLADAPRRN